MADHLEVQIKDAIEAALTAIVTAGNACGITVDSYNDRTVDSLLSSNYGEPGLYVEMEPEARITHEMGYFEAKFGVRVDARIKYSASPSTVDRGQMRKDLGTIKGHIETAMLDDDTFGGLAFSTEYKPGGLQADSDKAGDEAFLVRTFEVTYHYRLGQSDTPF